MNTIQSLIGVGVLIIIALGVWTVVELSSVKTDIAVINKDVAIVLKEVKELKSRPLQTARPPAAPSAPRNVKVSIDDDPVRGKADAPITIVEFSDYQCPFCKRFYDQVLPSIEKDYISTGKVRLVFRDYPLEFHKNALPAAIAANCAGKQGKYWEMHDFLFKNPDKLEVNSILSSAKELGLNRSELEKCMNDKSETDEINKDVREGQMYGVRGTPSFFIGRTEADGYITGVYVRGAQPYSVFKTHIDELLAEQN